MRTQQTGFTLVEIAIVLVIIGLLLGGILKGQELINSAKVKGLAQDFKNIQVMLYGYQDRFKAIPGDHAFAAGSPPIPGMTPATTGGTLGNGVIEGKWDCSTLGDEAALFWQHVRLAGFAAGPTDTANASYCPTNAIGARLGISSATSAQVQISGMTGTYQICSRGILGKFAKQLDVTLDDGVTTTGSVRVAADGGSANNQPAIAATGAGTIINDSDPYVVCLTF